MKKILSILTVFAIVLASCSKEVSLQKYMVSKSGEDGFMTVNVPSSMLQLKEDADPENIEALKKFKRLNVLIFKDSDSLHDKMQQEVADINKILSDDKFKELMSINMDGNYGILSYSGEDDDIREIVAFGENEQGFVLARILGDKMNVKQLAKLASAIDFENSNLEDLKNIDLDI